MIKELVFHLGDRKTGSTSIQDTLRVKNCTGGKSFRYLARGTMHNSRLAKSVYPGTGPEDCRKPFAELAEQIRASDADLGIVSSEKFEAASPACLQQALQAHLPEYAGQVRFIAYVRPHADRIASSWAERVKLGLFDKPLEAYAERAMKNGRFLYAGRFAEWREVFGGQFCLRPMIRSELHQNCVVRDFLNFAFREEAFQLLQEPAANESVCIEDLLILREWHRHLTAAAVEAGLPVQKMKNLRSALGRQMGIEMAAGLPRGSTKVRLHRQLVSELQTAFGEDAAALDQMFFAGRPMSEALARAGEKAQERPAPFDPAAYFDADSWRLAEGFCAFASKMALKHPGQWGKHFRQHKLGDANERKQNLQALKQG